MTGSGIPRRCYVQHNRERNCSEMLRQHDRERNSPVFRQTSSNTPCTNFVSLRMYAENGGGMLGLLHYRHALRYFAILILVSMVVALLAWPFRSEMSAQSANASQSLKTVGIWSQHNFDLIYTMAFSSAQQPDGPLIAYRASSADLRSAVAVAAVARSGLPQTPVFFPSPDGRYLALLNPQRMGYASNVNGAALSILPTDGSN